MNYTIQKNHWKLDSTTNTWKCYIFGAKASTELYVAYVARELNCNSWAYVTLPPKFWLWIIIFY